MKLLPILPLVCLFFGFASSVDADIEKEMRSATDALMPVMADAEALVVDGRLDEANQKILAVFPENSRTAAQAFLLGNVLFTQNPKASYELHKRAAHDLPDEPQVQYEWAMDQHRAGEWGGAAESYAVFSKAHADYAPAYGLCAECLLRLGKTKEAVAMWKKSEQARQGSLIDLETLVCAVHSHRFPDRERAKLLLKASGGDIGSAEQLMALDCEFERDWWNKGPKRNYLRHDLEILRKTKFADAERLNEILCAGDCAMASEQGKAAVGALLRQQGYLVGDNAKLPHSGAMLSIMLGNAVSSNVTTIADARAKSGAAVLDRAKAGLDAEMYNVAAALYVATDQLPDIDRAAWAATGDARFAAALSAWQYSKGTLKPDDPVLTAAAKKFPDNAILAGLILRSTAKEAKPGNPDQTALVNAIKAEYNHFSPASHAVGIDMSRPGAELLSLYFAMLAKEMEAK